MARSRVGFGCACLLPENRRRRWPGSRARGPGALRAPSGSSRHSGSADLARRPERWRQPPRLECNPHSVRADRQRHRRPHRIDREWSRFPARSSRLAPGPDHQPIDGGRRADPLLHRGRRSDPVDAIGGNGSRQTLAVAPHCKGINELAAAGNELAYVVDVAGRTDCPGGWLRRTYPRSPGASGSSTSMAAARGRLPVESAKSPRSMSPNSRFTWR